MACYQCFKTVNRTVYCSSYAVKNHTEGAAWVSSAMQHFSIQSNELLGRPYEADSIPSAAMTYPAG